MLKATLVTLAAAALIGCTSAPGPIKLKIGPVDAEAEVSAKVASIGFALHFDAIMGGVCNVAGSVLKYVGLCVDPTVVAPTPELASGE